MRLLRADSSAGTRWAASSVRRNGTCNRRRRRRRRRSRGGVVRAQAAARGRSGRTQSVPAHGRSSRLGGGSISCPGSAGGNGGGSNTPAGRTRGEKGGGTCNRRRGRRRRRRRGGVVRAQAAAHRTQSAPAHSHTDSLAGSIRGGNGGGGGGAATAGGGREITASTASKSVPRPICGTAANVERGVARSEEIHPKPGANRTGRLQNSHRGAKLGKVGGVPTEDVIN